MSGWRNIGGGCWTRRRPKNIGKYETTPFNVTYLMSHNSYGDRSFAAIGVTGPCLCNSLLSHLRHSDIDYNDSTSNTNTENVSVWIDCSAAHCDLTLCALHKYSYLLTHLLTWRPKTCPSRKNSQNKVDNNDVRWLHWSKYSKTNGT